jgi:hypothetical protein
MTRNVAANQTNVGSSERFPLQAHNSIAAAADYLFLPSAQFCARAVTPDTSPDGIWSIPMKTVILAALIVLGLGAGIADADPAGGKTPPQNGSQFNLTAGGAGWG